MQSCLRKQRHLPPDRCLTKGWQWRAPAGSSHSCWEEGFPLWLRWQKG